MLAIKKIKSDSQPSTANLLPCRIQYDGKMDISARMWNPETNADAKNESEPLVAHFRGRKLIGHTISLPKGYHGAAVCVTDTPLAEHGHAGNEEDSETKVAQQVAEFDKFVIWKHDNLPDAAEDEYIKGMSEWVQLAEQIHAP